MSKTSERALALPENMEANGYQGLNGRNATREVLGVHEVDTLTALIGQVANLSKQFSSLTTIANVIHAPTEVCNLCDGSHLSSECEARNPFALS